jgi:hypothetical protein
MCLRRQGYMGLVLQLAAVLMGAAAIPSCHEWDSDGSQAGGTAASAAQQQPQVAVRGVQVGMK